MDYRGVIDASKRKERRLSKSEEEQTTEDYRRCHGESKGKEAMDGSRSQIFNTTKTV
jgi:hypothetical protein